MAIEQSWLAVSPRLLTADGGEQGQIKLADTRGFKTKMLVIVQNSIGTHIEVQVKRVNKLSIVVGPKPGDPNTQQGKAGLKTYTDVRAFTVVGGAFVYAVEQGKTKLKPDDIIQAVYEQEPTVAIRTFPVDENGDSYTDENPFPTVPGGDQITPPEFDEVIIVRDGEDYPVEYQFLKDEAQVGHITVEYNANRSAVRYKGFKP